MGDGENHQCRFLAVKQSVATYTARWPVEGEKGFGPVLGLGLGLVLGDADGGGGQKDSDNFDKR